MSEKMIVTFGELPVLSCEMDYLSYCKACDMYGLDERPCFECGRKDNISIDEIAEKKVYKQLAGCVLLQMLSYLLLYILSKDTAMKIGVTLFTVVLIAGDLLIYKKYKKYLVEREIRKHILTNIDKIRMNLKTQLKAATEEVDEGDLKAAYERLRYLSKLIDNDEVRTFKLICLMNFQLRSDMPLEMNTLLQQDYSAFLIDYIYEISKIRKDLIDEDTILYVLEFKEQVLQKRRGKQIMASVLEASLRSKYLLEKYAKYMLGYIQYFSKGRLLRLCKLSSCIKDEVLRREILREIKESAAGNEAVNEYTRTLE